MRSTRRYLAATGALALAATSLPGHANSADEAAVRKAIDDLVKARMARDKATLEAVLSDQLIWGQTSGRVETKAEVVGAVVANKPIFKSITIGDPTISVVGNNAVAHYTAAVELDSEGKEISLKLGIMTFWVKDGGTWKLLAHQSFKPT
jgi:ketosteroid isomerase-like protein